MTPSSPTSPSPAAAGLHDASRQLLTRLAERPWAAGFYLAGSAALTSYLGHRPVRDLDLMGESRRLASPERRDLLEDLLRLDPDLKVETARDGFLYTRTGSGAALRLFYYPYPMLDPLEQLAGFQRAALVDLALMKLGAVISRGTKRDFVDLCLICRHVSLAELLRRAPRKFGHVRDFPLQALKGLADLGQAAEEPMPRLAVALSWDEVEEWLAGEVRQVARQRVGLPS